MPEGGLKTRVRTNRHARKYGSGPREEMEDARVREEEKGEEEEVVSHAGATTTESSRGREARGRSFINISCQRLLADRKMLSRVRRLCTCAHTHVHVLQSLPLTHLRL